MINRLYNPWHITNSGERETDKQLSIPCSSEESMYVIHGMRVSSRYHATQMAGECDFVVISRLGLTVMEVKGGLIGYGTLPDGGTGYYRMLKERKRESIGDPFSQVDGNADAVKKYLKEKEIGNIFVGSVVCFPECSFGRDGIGEDELWHRGHESTLSDFILLSMESQTEQFHKKERIKRVSRYAEWEELDEEAIKKVIKVLEPEFDPSYYRSLLKMNIEESARREKEGLSVLSGLNENRRLIIQGPPGSGKSTYALNIIARKSREGKSGIYICWNELLAAEMRARLSDQAADIPEERIKVMLYFDLAVELGEQSGDRSLIPSKETVKRGELRQCVKGALAKAGRNKPAEKFDYVIVDEAQDIFDKGVDYMLKALLKGNNPVENGDYYIFYDDSQDYPDGSDLSNYIRTRDLLKGCAASYNLTDSLRTGTGNGIGEFILDASKGVIDPGKKYGEDVSLDAWKDPADALRKIRAAVAKEKGLGGLGNSGCIVLFTADLLKEGSPIPALLNADGGFELLTAGNTGKTQSGINYTTMLKAKGLERDVVILVGSGLTDKRNQFQLFIGASRARARIWLLTKNE